MTERFLVIDENEGGVQSRHATLDLAMEAAREIVDDYREMAERDGEWNGDESVMVVEVRQCWKLESVESPEDESGKSDIDYSDLLPQIVAPMSQPVTEPHP